MIHVRTCREADQEHARSARRYAHVGHYRGTVCLARAAVFELPANYLAAILLHELGHLALLPAEHSERDADRAGSHLAGVRIVRRSYGPARRLEYVTTRELPKAWRAIYRLTDVPRWTAR